MQVILLQQVPGLGQKWDIKTVKDGYARNFLFPQKLAQPATRALLSRAEEDREKKTKEKEKLQETHGALAKNLAGISLLIGAKADEKGTLFGSVGRQEIADALKKKKLEIPLDVIRLEKDIKKTGEHDVHLDFGDGVKTTIKIDIIAEEKKEK